MASDSNRIILRGIYDYFRSKRLVLSKSDDTSLLFKVPYFSGDFDSSFRGISWVRTELVQYENQLKIKVNFKITNFFLWILIISISVSYFDHIPLLQSVIINFLIELFLIYSIWIVSLQLGARYVLHKRTKEIHYVILKLLNQNKKKL